MKKERLKKLVNANFKPGGLVVKINYSKRK